MHYEAELGLLIGEQLKNVDEATAARGIWGLTCFNDVTARDIQRREVQHTRAKSYDTFACAGPWVVTGLCPGGSARPVPGERTGAPGQPDLRHGVQPGARWCPSSPTS